MKNARFNLLFFIGLLVAPSALMAQVNTNLNPNNTVMLDGYTFEQFNRGFLREVKITILDKSEIVVAETVTDSTGHFSVPVAVGKDYILQAEKRIFTLKRQDVAAANTKVGEVLYLKVEMARQPGYLFEMTLAEKRYGLEEIPVDGVNGARVEIYNNTKQATVLSVDSTKNPSLNYTFEQGNHYTILIRRKGFYNKRLEAHINIDGCILCFEGVGTVTPGMVDNLTNAADHKIGTLIANIEMERIDTTRNVVLQNIYYDYNSANLRLESKRELEKLANVLQNNPSLIVELGSHTDSRGSEEANLQLSKWRAQAAVDYIAGLGKVSVGRMKAKGYGESRLVNRCADGVLCSDKEHEQNRRTELRIISFTKVDPYESLSLAEIIHEEQMQKMMANPETAFSSEEYIAPEKAVVTTETIKGKGADNTPPSPENIGSPNGKMPEMPQVAPAKTPNAAIEPVKVTTTMPKAKEAAKEVSKGAAKATTKTAVATMRDQKASVATDSSVNAVVKPSLPASPSSVAPAFEEKVVAPLEKTVEKTVEKVIEKTTPTPVATPAKPTIALEVSPLEEKYSGYSIYFLTSNAALSKDAAPLQKIAEQFSSQVFFQKAEGNEWTYYVGLFQFWGETEAYLAKVLKAFPNAQIVDFYNGKKVK